MLGKQPIDSRLIGQVAPHEGEAATRRKLRDTRLLRPHVVVGAHVVEADDFVAAIEEGARHVEANEAGDAGDEKLPCFVGPLIEDGLAKSPPQKIVPGL